MKVKEVEKEWRKEGREEEEGKDQIWSGEEVEREWKKEARREKDEMGMKRGVVE